MKKNLLPAPLRLLAFPAVVLSLVQAVSAQTIWNGTNGVSVSTNWSDSANWSTLAIPGSGDIAKFDEPGETLTASNIDNIVDAAFGGTVNALQYVNTNGFHTTLIAPGVTLNVSGGAFSVGTTVNSGVVTVNPTITGRNGAALNVSGTSVGISQGSNGKSILDLSGLDTFSATVATIGVGAINYPATDSSDVGTLILAKTNTLTISGSTTSGSGSGVQSGFLIGDPRTSGPTAGSSVQLGLTNAIYANLIVVGARKGGTSTHAMIFNPAFTNANPVALFRAADGSSPVPTWSVGDDFFASGGSTVCNGSVNLTGGTVDALVVTNIIGRGQGGAGNRGTGTFTYSAGTLNVGWLQIGFQSGTTAANGPGTGTVNVNGTATLIATNVIELTHITIAGAAAGTTVGALNVNGGTVLANRIVNGGGQTSTLTMTNASLVLSNTIGTPGAAISVCAVSNTTFRLTIFAAPTTNIVVTNLVTGGATNRVNIDSLPAIGSYPAIFKLVKYTSQTGVFNIGLGTLPVSSPAFAGYVTNNTTAGSVDLVITTGPAPPGTPLLWTAANTANWDTSTTNWSNFGSPSKYTDGSPVRFDDTAANGSVTLAALFGPASTTISNNALAYTFTGNGTIGAGGGLTKQGPGALTLDNAGGNSYSGGTLIAGGTLQIGNNDAAGTIGSGNITNNASLIFNRSDNITLASPISGTGSLTKNGNGTLALNANSSFSGTALVNTGALLVNGTLSGGGLLTNAVGTTLGGNGTNTGFVDVSGLLAPGTTNTAGTFGAGGLTMDSGATLALDVSANNSVGGGVNDLLQVSGNLTLNNNSISVNLLGAPANNSSYRIANYSGTLSGTFNPVVTINGGVSHGVGTLDYSTAHQINLVFTNFASLVWASTGSGEWDNGSSQNWSNALTTVTPDFFYAGDAVLFDDTPGVVTTIDLASGVVVLPASVVIDATNNSFTISGAGKITGPTGLVKKGDSTLTLSTANDFTGTTVVSGGILKLGSVAAANFALGSTNTPAIVTNNGTLDLAGFGGGSGTRTLGNKQVIVSGAGFNGQGAIINSTGGRSDNALANVTLAGDATLAANGTSGGFSWNIRNLGGGSSLSTGGHAYNLTILGPARLSLFSVNVDPALANIDVQGGQFDLGDFTSGLGNPTNTLTVESGATLSFLANNPPNNTTSQWNKVFIFNGDGSTTTVNNRGGNGHTMIGPVQLNGSCIFSGNLTNANAITGSGSLTRIGGGALHLLGTNTYAGDTTVNAGILALEGNGVIQGSPNIVLNTTTIDVSGRSDGKLTLFTNQTLTGSGTVRGSLLVGAGSTVSPGGNGTSGTLTVTNVVTLLGTNSVDIDRDGGTNDVITGAVSINYGGTLNLNILNTAPQLNDSYKLFNATGYSGAFVQIIPATPGAGLLWDTSSLTANGTLKVISSTPPSPPHITGFSLSGTTLTITATNGALGGQYVLLQTTNLVLPLAQWTPVLTNVFDGSGNLNLSTNVINPASRQAFYILKQ